MKFSSLLAIGLLLCFAPATFCADAPQRVTFAKKYSLELPAGWTTKMENDELHANIPGEGTGIFFARVHKTAKTVDAVLEDVAAKLKKNGEAKLLDEDEVATKEGKKGKLAYYHQDFLGEKRSVLSVAFQMTPDEVVQVHFAFEKESGVVNHQQKITAIYSSLKASE